MCLHGWWVFSWVEFAFDCALYIYMPASCHVFYLISFPTCDWWVILYVPVLPPQDLLLHSQPPTGWQQFSSIHDMQPCQTCNLPPHFAVTVLSDYLLFL